MGDLRRRLSETASAIIRLPVQRNDATGTAFASLSVSPSEFGLLEIVVLVISILAKTLTGLLGLSGGWQREESTETLRMPRLEVRCPLNLTTAIVRGLEEVVARARGSTKALNSGSGETTSPFVLVAPTNPLMILLLSHQSCPLQPLGALHVRNRFEILQPAAFRSDVVSKSWSCRARMGGDFWARRVRKGVEVDIHVEVHDKSRSPSTPVFRQIITVMQPSRKLALRSAAPTNSEPVWHDFKKEQNDEPIDISLSTDLARLWASICKDYNPIHHSNTLARYVFGMPGTIAHGNCVVVGAFAATEGYAGSQSDRITSSSDQPWYLDVVFKRPMTLPMHLHVYTQEDKTATADKGGDSDFTSLQWRAINSRRQSPKDKGSGRRQEDIKAYVYGTLGLLSESQ